MARGSGSGSGIPPLVLDGGDELAVERVRDARQQKEAAEQRDALEEQLAERLDRVQPDLLLKRRERLYQLRTSNARARDILHFSDLHIITKCMLINVLHVQLLNAGRRGKIRNRKQH